MLSLLARYFSRLDAITHSGVGEKYNPFTQLGSLAITNIAIALATGILLLFFYDVNIHSAYESVEAMSKARWSTGILHSLHRYSSDLAMLLVFLHFVKILVNKVFRGPRALSWVTGCLALFTMWFIGWTGFWLAWDHNGFLVAQFSTRLIDGIALFGTTLEASLLTGDSSNNNIFFIVFFIHMLVPLGLFIMLWIHVSRVNRPKFISSKPIALLSFAFLLLIALAYPAPLEVKASPFVLKEAIHLDLFYLLPIKLFERFSAGGIWFTFFASYLFLNLVPWIFKGKAIQPSFVTESLCVGCSSCFNDCPYQAIELLPRTDGKPYKVVAWVDPEKCVGCGVCNGSCDTLGNNLPWLPTEVVMQKIDQWAQESKKPQWLLFVCSAIHSGLQVKADYSTLEKFPQFRVMEVPCVGHVNPNSVRRALEMGFKGVFIAASLPGDCLYREGNQWLEDRLANKRKPLGRFNEKQQAQIHVGHYAQGDQKQILDDLEMFSESRLAS